MKTGYWHITSADESLFKYRHTNGAEDLTLHGKSFDEEFQKLPYETAWTDFKSYIDTNNIPALVFWGSCGQCLSFRKNALSHSNFKSYASSAIGQTYMYFIASETSAGNDAVKQFCRSVTRQFPYIRLYWKKQDGSISSCDVSRGTSGYANSADGATNLVNKMKATFAGYSPSKVVITFDANGGSGSYGPEEVFQGQSFTLPNAAVFTKSGCKQSGWQIGLARYAFGQSFTPSADTVVKAIYISDEQLPLTPEPDVQVDDPTVTTPSWKLSDGGKFVAVEKAQFPFSWQYKSTGHKRIAMSSNISSLNAHGLISNSGLENQLVSAYIQPGMLEIEASCFYNCTSLIGINADNNIKKVGNYAFYNCHSLQAVNFLGDANKYLQTIGSHAFDGCGFRSIKINHKGSISDSSMDEWCFANNKQLSAVEFLQSTYLGSHMFDGCEKLRTIKLNNYHSYVGDYAFANCKALTSITLPPNMYMISEHMFDSCMNLAKVKFQSESHLRQIGDCAFNGCPKLTSIELPESVNDLEYLDPMWLAGSSIDRVVFCGLGDEAFSESYQQIKNLAYKTNHWYWKSEDIKKVLEDAKANHIPVIVGTGLVACSQCEATWKFNYIDETGQIKTDASKGHTYQINLDSIDFTGTGTFNNSTIGDYLKPKNCYWLFGVKNRKMTKKGFTDVYDSVSTITSLIGFEWKSPSPDTVFYWLKPDGTEVEKVFADSNTKSFWLKELKTFLDPYDGNEYETIVTIKSSLNTFGRGAPVTFVSSSGAEYLCENNTITKLPTYRVDHRTKDNFKYNIWYYNARELKAFADAENLPVLVEWGAKSCDPCRDFAKNTFRNKDFQDALKSRACLLCKVQLESEGSFSSQPATSQEYFVSHNWGNPNTLIPQLVFYWKKSASDTYSVVWNYNYRSDKANANYQTVLNKLDVMLGNYAGDPQHEPPVVSTTEDGRCKYYPTESLVESGYLVESGKYVAANGTIANGSSEYAVVTINADPTCKYYVHTCCDATHCIHVYDSSGQVVGAVRDSTGAIVGSDCVVGDLPASASNELAVYCIDPPSDAAVIKVTNVRQTGASALPLKYRATYDIDGRYFICDKKAQTTSWSGTIDIDLPGVKRTGLDGNDDIAVPTMPVASITVGQTIDLEDNWYQWCVPDLAQASFVDRSGVIFKVFGLKVESIWTFENEDESFSLDDNNDFEYANGQWQVVDDTTGSNAVDSIVSQCQLADIPLIVVESDTKDTGFVESLKSSGVFAAWMRQKKHVFIDARSSTWASNGPKAVRDFESRTSFESNTVSDPLPKILVYQACSSCTADGSLEVYCRRKIAFNSTWSTKNYMDTIDAYLDLI